MTRRGALWLLLASAIVIALGVVGLFAWLSVPVEPVPALDSRPASASPDALPSFDAPGAQDAPTPSSLAAAADALPAIAETEDQADESDAASADDEPTPMRQVAVSVVDAASNPVPGAVIQAFADDEADAWDEASAATTGDAAAAKRERGFQMMMREDEPTWKEPLGSWTTDGSGSSLLDAPDRVLLLVAERDGKGTSGVVMVEGTKEAQGRAPVTLKLLPRGTLRGRVLEIDGSPAVGAQVVFSRSHLPDESHRRPRVPHPVQTDGEGKFVVEVDTDFYSSVHAERGDSKTVSEFAHVGPGESAEIELRFPGAYAITGIVLGPDGAPVPSALVRTAGYKLRADSAPTDENGRFRLVLTRPCHAGLMARADGLVQEQPVGATVSDAQPTADVEIRLGQPASIWGTVHWTDGAPLADGVVSARISHPSFDSADALRAYMADSDRADFEVSINAMGMLRPDGSFQVDGIPPGRNYDLNVYTQQPVSGRPELKGIAAGSAGVELIAKRIVPGTDVLRGHVIDAVSRVPLSPCEVSCADWRFIAVPSFPAEHAAVDAADASFRIEGLTPDTDYGLLVEAVNYPAQRFGPFKPSDSADIELAVGRPGSLDIRVTDADGHPQAASVQLTEAASPSFGKVMGKIDVRTAGADGRLTWPDLVPGSYVLCAASGPRRAPAVKLRVAAQQATPVQVVVREAPDAGRMEVRVQHGDGRPAAGASIRVIRLEGPTATIPDAGSIWLGTAGDDGAALFEGLEAGSYLVASPGRDEVIAPERADVITGQTVSVLLKPQDTR